MTESLFYDNALESSVLFDGDAPGDTLATQPSVLSYDGLSAPTTPLAATSQRSAAAAPAPEPAAPQPSPERRRGGAPQQQRTTRPAPRPGPPPPPAAGMAMAAPPPLVVAEQQYPAPGQMVQSGRGTRRPQRPAVRIPPSPAGPGPRQPQAVQQQQQRSGRLTILDQAARAQLDSTDPAAARVRAAQKEQQQKGTSGCLLIGAFITWGMSYGAWPLGFFLAAAFTAALIGTLRSPKADKHNAIIFLVLAVVAALGAVIRFKTG